MTLTGIHALVTGGGRGLGRASALALARAGAMVSVLARSADEVAETVWLIEENGQRALGLTADVRASDQLDRAVSQARDHFGPIRVLVAAAGIGLRAPIQETTEEQWDAVVDTLLKGVFLSAKAVIPQMIEGGGGNIIVIGAPLDRIAVPGFATYYAAKAGVDGLARVMAKDLRRFGINVNIVHPGGFADTLMVRTTVPEVRTGLLSPDEIGPAVVELAALPPRSQTGQTIDAHARKLAQN
ncbi:SDR family NAD(P)-dependent oxidoreductase [Chloroflexus sp. MS-CIW-1]|jgi:3-oxoacyl-[acyl-carrier protein] reductase|uniref:SDR family NAD(P)-dependent oxidoreductase n=1 Tax=unclassified Chloroflexus TaxID=2633855 RepID=UPI0004DECD1D|nr:MULTISPECIES: SDR family NAD(P)-dependent oxidoreductase [unclassified Chloroflexus]MBO9337738.1 SDR family NAD(P)-dependent oxidoreductase [Chloroflexus sp.]MBO9349800.1 SDR family NAD(P)-dependent oxidoreductase [Chloroflexus sp.]MDN5272497.1 SDR family NAD(P)-dependent oxidoreductase [Chloroflexus sp. MS-CIW-1]